MEIVTRSTAFSNHSVGDQFNAHGGVVNTSRGQGTHLSGSTFNGPVSFGKEKPAAYSQQSVVFAHSRKEAEAGQSSNLPDDCWRSLAFPRMDRRFDDISSAAKGTCTWILQHETYVQWTLGDRNLIWVKGIPGSGKSTLLRYMVKHVEKVTSYSCGEKPLILSFFFNGHGTLLEKTPLGLYRSLLYQLKDVPNALSDVLDTFRDRIQSIGKPEETWEWKPHEMREFFKTSLRNALRIRPVWLYIDALDECDIKYAKKVAEVFQALLKTIQDGDMREFRICLACRHCPILADSQSEIILEKENGPDLAIYIRGQLEVFGTQARSKISELIITRARGMFLWTRLVVKRILDLWLEGAHVEEMKAEISSPQPVLNDLYYEVIGNMDRQSQKLVRWVCFAMRPLSLLELRCAMLVKANYRGQMLGKRSSIEDVRSSDEMMTRKVQTLGRGLVEVVPRDGAMFVQFIHHSVQDFFRSGGLSRLASNVNSGRKRCMSQQNPEGLAHYHLAKTCVQYLTMYERTQSRTHAKDSLVLDFPLLQYATVAWLPHAQESASKGIRLYDLLDWSSEPFVAHWVQLHGKLAQSRYPPKGTTMLHIVSRHALLDPLGSLLRLADRGGRLANAKDVHGRTPLSYAAEEGHTYVVELLLATRRTGLVGRVRLISWMLERQGVKVNTRDKSGETPLIRAAKGGHEGVARLLLSHGADVDAHRDEQGRTPLSLAAGGGHVGVVKLLLEHGACAHHRDFTGETPLSHAAKNQHEDVIKLLPSDSTIPDTGDDADRRAAPWLRRTSSVLANAGAFV
ncbi:Ankyrin repeat-containing domain protein [Moelleriella libera RCEF 2490]|uniref:Ankyrin repeat-containing domain protein n=1 Tax=Moelleriella libera RCEF 2490 TaxID=1081109 RepID=A0A167YVK1_9HYPO|nr:Ankyrin repeat-containing domain protein [Moelleriella libera RCEF 2490]